MHEKITKTQQAGNKPETSWKQARNRPEDTPEIERKRAEIGRKFSGKWPEIEQNLPKLSGTERKYAGNDKNWLETSQKRAADRPETERKQSGNLVRVWPEIGRKLAGN